MAEIQHKRLRDELPEESSSSPKRQKTYDSILNLLEVEEEDGDPSQDLSAMLTSFQQELESSSSTAEERKDAPDLGLDSSMHGGTGDDEAAESVMRHLLEASDDELGIPSGGTEDWNAVDIIHAATLPFGSGENVPWEFEDETANFYAASQSEFPM
ncbi:hypothetical protein M569_16896 [Genlisea aurea]|uniref:Uncharacterized protein n=1 Tax=Genlisea aurea TaxID=192259 RepID=S8C0I5_9LAMI|nr:hypothetical protein M569_16896 [Genlisea aurea]